MAATATARSVVFPGDDISIEGIEAPRIGLGTMQRGRGVVATTVGRVAQAGPTLWVEHASNRYVPCVRDVVVGVVREKAGDFFSVDIGAALPATIHFLQFEGATRRNRPDLREGSVIYARVVAAHRGVDPELSCIAESGKADGLGALKGGRTVVVAASLLPRLLSPASVVLAPLGGHIPYEIAVGLNRRVWIRTAEPRHAVVIANLLKNAAFLNDAKCVAYAEALIAGPAKK